MSTSRTPKMSTVVDDDESTEEQNLTSNVDEITNSIEEEFERRVKKSKGSVGHSRQTTKDWSKTIGKRNF